MYSTNNKEKHIFHLEDILGIPNFWKFKRAKPMVLFLEIILKMMFDWADIKEIVKYQCDLTVQWNKSTIQNV